MLILASQSKSRQELLDAAGVDFTSVSAQIDEEAIKSEMRTEGASAKETSMRKTSVGVRYRCRPDFGFERRMVFQARKPQHCAQTFEKTPQQNASAGQRRGGRQKQKGDLVRKFCCSSDHARFFG